jgi:hypothetical protein
LGALATYTFTENFKRTSLFADMLPSYGDFLSEPLQSLRTLGQVIKLTSEHNAAKTAEQRKKSVDDVMKRNQYRRAHGLDDVNDTWGWTAKSSGAQGPASPGQGQVSEDPAEADVRIPERKKWLGIF